MKRILALILCITLVCTLFCVPAFAESPDKISKTLQKRMETMREDEKIEVWIFTAIDGGFRSSLELKEYVDRLTRQELIDTYGLERATEILRFLTMEDVDLYRSIYDRIMGEIVSKNNYVVIEKLGISEDDVVYIGFLCSDMILNLSKDQIYKAADLEEVESLDFDSSEGPYEPLDTPALKGDADEDGYVSVMDATLIQKVEAELVDRCLSLETADVDSDGEITVLDATLIQKSLADLVEL